MSERWLQHLPATYMWHAASDGSAYEELLDMPALAADRAFVVRDVQRTFIARRRVTARNPAGTERALQADHTLLYGGLLLSDPPAFFQTSLFLVADEGDKILERRMARRWDALNPRNIVGVFLQQLVEIPVRCGE